MSNKSVNTSMEKFVKVNLDKFHETKLKMKDLLKIYNSNIEVNNLDGAINDFEEISNIFNLLITYKKSLASCNIVVK